MTWIDRAACRDVDPRIFHDPDTVSQAIAVCADCPVTTECGQAREQDEQERGSPVVGVWGGVEWHPVEDAAGNITEPKARARERSIL